MVQPLPQMPPTSNPRSLRGLITLWTLFMFSSLIALIHAKAYFDITIGENDNDLLLVMVGAFLAVLVWQISWYFRD